MHGSRDEPTDDMVAAAEVLAAVLLLCPNCRVVQPHSRFAGLPALILCRVCRTLREEVL